MPHSFPTRRSSHLLVQLHLDRTVSALASAQHTGSHDINIQSLFNPTSPSPSAAPQDQPKSLAFYPSYIGYSQSALKAATLPRSAEHTSELQSLMRHPYAVFCLKTKKNNTIN